MSLGEQRSSAQSLLAFSEGGSTARIAVWPVLSFTTILVEPRVNGVLGAAMVNVDRGPSCSLTKCKFLIDEAVVAQCKFHRQRVDKTRSQWHPDILHQVAPRLTFFQSLERLALEIGESTGALEIGPLGFTLSLMEMAP